MTERRVCPQCGAKLAADGPGGLCPECLLRQGLEGGDPLRTATVLGASFVPPHPENLAPMFPQLEILELLGKGGMGAVYKVRQPSLDRLVALKILPPKVGQDPAFAERFAREARALARLSHQNIVAVYDFGRATTGSPEDGEALTGHEVFFLIMEYVDGANLRQLMQQGRLTPAEAITIVPQICEALQFAHEEGIVHRDIKPENILIDRRGRVKIADFGLAKLLRVQPIDVTLTAADQVMGTWHYMAPEQIEHPAHVDHRADIYSLGVVFYEMLTGQLPLGRFELPSNKARVDVRLDQVVLRALEREPERRYQYASEVKTDVEAIGEGGHPAAVANESSPALERIADTLDLFKRGLVYFFVGIVSGVVVENFDGQFRSLGLNMDSPLIFIGLAMIVWGGLMAIIFPPAILSRWFRPAGKPHSGPENLPPDSRGAAAAAAPAASSVREFAAGWLNWVLVLFCVGLLTAGLVGAWQYGTLGRWGGPTVEVDPRFAWLRWPLVGMWLLITVLGVAGLVHQLGLGAHARVTEMDPGMPVVVELPEWLDAAASGDADRLVEFVKQGADIDATDPKNGQTALVKAAAGGHVAAVAALITRRADAQARDNQGKTPLMHAVENGHREVVRLLSDLEQIHWNDQVQHHVTRLDPQFPTGVDFWSLRVNIAVDAQDAWGETALMKAAARGDGECVELLASASRELRDRQGRTALAHAVLNRQTSFLESALERAESLLADHSGVPSYTGFVSPEVPAIVDEEGKSPLELADEHELRGIAARMRRYLESVVQRESEAIDQERPHAGFSHYIRGLCRQTLGDLEGAEADLAKSRQL